MKYNKEFKVEAVKEKILKLAQKRCTSGLTITINTKRRPFLALGNSGWKTKKLVAKT